MTDEKILLGERSRLHNRWLPVDRFFAKWTMFCVQWKGWKPHLLKRMKTHGWLGNLRFFCTNLMLGTLDFTGSEHRATLCPVGGYNCSICLRAQPWTWFTFAPFKVIEEKIKTSGRVKQIVEIPMEFRGSTDTRRGGRGGRGGRGDRGGRGGRGRGRGGFGGRADSDKSGDNFALNAEEFPTLG